MATERPGGLAAWAPRVVPGPGTQLTPAQELAVALRHLDDVGWCENLTGHITSAVPDGLLVNPCGLWWAEVRTGDLLTIDTDGHVLDGALDVTPAVHIHTELHRRRPDARVVVHNHPPYASALAAVGELPDLVHQNSSILADELVLVDEYAGEVDDAGLGADLAARIGDASVALLVSHGVIVTAPTIAEAVYKAVLFERTCMLHCLVRAMGRTARPIAPGHQKQLKASLVERAAPVYWNGVVRALVAAEPDLLT
ncbi:MAG TPA: class II aldolase/adducin family protein [Acidimicrobiia bacterium]|nr:class II aldolase/adducin family protein [Acidimicrobiia bacterium]